MSGWRFGNSIFTRASEWGLVWRVDVELATAPRGSDLGLVNRVVCWRKSEPDGVGSVAARANTGRTKQPTNRFARWSERGIWHARFAAVAGNPGTPGQAALDGSHGKSTVGLGAGRGAEA